MSSMCTEPTLNKEKAVDLKILSGPTLTEISKGMMELAQDRDLMFVFKVSSVGDRRNFPDIILKVSKMRVEAKNEDKFKFRFMGRTESGEGDKCKANYYPLRKNKGVIRIYD